jgi:hypothetical protein
VWTRVHVRLQVGESGHRSNLEPAVRGAARTDNVTTARFVPGAGEAYTDGRANRGRRGGER